jgi:hypothetical protein
MPGRWQRNGVQSPSDSKGGSRSLRADWFGRGSSASGNPDVQWLWSGFNVSPFLDIPVVPSFTSVAALRQELHVFLLDPARYRPTLETQQLVLRECFGSDPAEASASIAAAVQQIVCAEAASARNATRCPSARWRSISGTSNSSQSSALETLPGRSFAATQSPRSLNRNSGW